MKVLPQIYLNRCFEYATYRLKIWTGGLLEKQKPVYCRAKGIVQYDRVYKEHFDSFLKTDGEYNEV